MDSCPSDEVVGGFFLDFEAIRTVSSEYDAPRRLFEKWDLENGVINRRLKAEADEKDRCGGGVLCFSSIDGSTPVLRRRRRPDVAAMACRGEGVAGDAPASTGLGTPSPLVSTSASGHVASRSRNRRETAKR